MRRMNRPALALSMTVCVAIGLGAGYWIADNLAQRVSPPPSRSVTTLPENFAPPGVTGEVRSVLLEQDLLKRTRDLADLLERLGPESLKDVRDAYQSVFIDLSDTELVLFGAWWARFDPETALRWTNSHWETRGSMPVTRGILREWGRNDPMAAMQATHIAPNQTIRRRWVDSVLRGWDESRHGGALAYAESLPPGEERQWALYIVSRRKVLRDGPEAAIAWVEALPDDQKMFKSNAFKRIAGAVAEVDPEAATAFASRHLDGPFAEGLPRRIAMRWADHDPEGAMAWLSTLPDNPNRNDGVRETFRHWLILDRKAARAWIRDQEHERWLDSAVSVFAKGLGRRSPVEALGFAHQIHDPKIRRQTVIITAREWLIRNEASANEWLAQADLEEEWLGKIRTISPGMRKSLR
jgi:hypothetical protein